MHSLKETRAHLQMIAKICWKVLGVVAYIVIPALGRWSWQEKKSRLTSSTK